MAAQEGLELSPPLSAWGDLRSPLTVLHRDDDLIAVAKPSGMVVHWTRGADDAPVLLRWLADQLGHQVFPVHRIDRQGSGVIVLGTSSAAASQLCADIRDQRWQKRYLVLCRGLLREPTAVDHPVPEDEQRRPAQTDITPVEHFCNRYTLAEARPHTGRRHQLRYHFKHLRHPLVGDTQYGQGPINRFFRQQFDLHRLFLHAESLALPHPRHRSTLHLHCPLAPELAGVLDALRCYDGPVA